MDRREYTPTKLSQLTNISNANLTTRQALDRSKGTIEINKGDYTRNSLGPQEINITKDYEIIKLQVKQL